jgi:hypothetical protein
MRSSTSNAVGRPVHYITSTVGITASRALVSFIQIVALALCSRFLDIIKDEERRHREIQTDRRGGWGRCLI